MRKRRICPHPIAIPFYFCLVGRFFKFGMGDGAQSGFFKEEAAEFKMQMQNSYRAFVHHITKCPV